jgi:hypothetical protein
MFTLEIQVEGQNYQDLSCIWEFRAKFMLCYTLCFLLTAPLWSVHGVRGEYIYRAPREMK